LGDRSTRTEVVLEPIPHIAHGSVAVAKVRRAARRRSLRDAVAARKDEVVAGKIEPADRPRKEGKKGAIASVDAGNRLQRRGEDPMLLDPLGHGTGRVEE